MGFYGGFSIDSGKMTAVWNRRSVADAKKGISQNAGLYYACCSDSETGQGEWTSLKGHGKSLPIVDFGPYSVAEPAQSGDYLSFANHVMTKSGHVVAALTKNQESFLAVCKSGSTEFQFIPNMPKGYLFTHDDFIYLVGLDDERPCVWSASEDTLEWKEACKVERGPQFSHGASVKSGASIYYLALQKKPNAIDARPLHLFRFNLQET